MERNWREICGEVYHSLQDEESRFIFEKRLMYSLTKDVRYLRELVASLPEAKWLRAEILRGEKNFIFGAGDYGRAVYALAPHAWMGILDNNKRKWGGKIGGATIVPPETILEYPDARIFLAVHKMGKHYQAAILEQLRTMGIAEERIVHVDRLIDRLGARAYFDLPWLPHVADEVFVDGGAYDGASSKNFAAWAKSFEHIYAFEPDVANLPLCEETLSEFSKEKTDVFACGLWHEETTLSFDGKASPMSKVDDKGAEHVAVDALDHVLAGKRVTFIKMDIEGAEMEALRGAEQLIRTQHPKLAISVYHKPDDIEEIPAFIHEMYPAYKMYLRHYTLLQYDTVIYCV